MPRLALLLLAAFPLLSRAANCPTAIVEFTPTRVVNPVFVNPGDRHVEPGTDRLTHISWDITGKQALLRFGHSGLAALANTNGNNVILRPATWITNRDGQRTLWSALHRSRLLTVTVEPGALRVWQQGIAEDGLSRMESLYKKFPLPSEWTVEQGTMNSDWTWLCVVDSPSLLPSLYS